MDEDTFEEIWTNGIITFDTCSMCRMYEWEYNDAINIKDILSYLFTNGHIWETQYNYEEFNIQRVDIKNSIFQQKYENGIFKHLKKSPIPWRKIDSTLQRWEGKGYSPLFIDKLEELHSKKHITDNEIDQLRLLAQSLPPYPNADELFDAILYNSDFILSDQEKSKLIEKYINSETCPGSCDKDKHNGRKYNDLFMWELIKKKAQQNDKDFIFVTSDTKSDWFIDGIPRAEYAKEFQIETGRNVLIMTLVDFWECCKPYIDLPIEDFIMESTIQDQLAVKYDDCYEQDICNKVQDLIFDSNEITFALEDIVHCCVDMPVIDQINECKIDEIYPLPYTYGNQFVTVIIEMVVDISFDAQNHTAGEDWSAGCGSIIFNMTAVGSIAVEWSSEDTNRIVLKDSISVDEINDVTVISTNMDEDDPEDDIYDQEDENFEDYDYQDMDVDDDD